jgi:hypothetical protein
MLVEVKTERTTILIELSDLNGRID